MTASLVLATVGRTDDVMRLLRSLVAQTSQDFELIIVDQNPDDRLEPHVRFARDANLQVRHLRMLRPNLSAARNLGIAEARGAVIAFPDDDCWYEPEVVATVLTALASHADWTGLVAQWVEQARSHGDMPCAPLLSAARWRRFRDGDASSISLFLRTEALRSCGGFDARLGVGQWFGAGEETDLVLGLLGRGAQLARCPHARVHHRHVPAAQVQDGTHWRQALRRARGTGALYVKHRLAPAVIVRGLLAPALKSLWPWGGRRKFGLGVAASAGRLQGALAWLVGWRQS